MKPPEPVREPRIKNERCTMKTLTLAILIVMIIQVTIMLVPITTAGVIYNNNRENFIALGNVEGTRLVTDINHLPLAAIGKKSNSAMDDAKHALHETLLMVEKAKIITKRLHNGTILFDNIQKLIAGAIEPLEGITDLLSPQMRGTIKHILDKVLRIIENMSDEEIHDLIMKLQKVSEQANGLLSVSNQNKTMHVIEDADITLLKMDKMLSKFVN